MRKYLAVLLGVLLILSFAVTAFAEDKTEITIGGKILVRGWYLDNVVNSLPQNEWDSDGLGHIIKGNSQAWYSTNVNLMVNAKVADNIIGMVELESARGESTKSGLYMWGDGGAGYDSKPDAEILIRQAWILYTGAGLGIPAGIKIGHMPISLSEKLFLNNERFGDDAILVWIDPTKELHIAAGTVKLNEAERRDHWDDADGYVLLGTYAINKDITVGLNYLLVHSDGNCPALGPDTNIDDLNFNNIGLHANGKVAGFSFAGEIDKQFGKANGLPGAPDLKAKGWAAMAKVGYQLDPVNIRGSVAIGSGDDDDADEDCEEFQTLMGTDYDLTARLVHYTQIYERTLATAATSAILTTQAGGNSINTGIANTTYFNLGADVTPMKNLSISLDGFILRATEVGVWEDAVGDDVSKNIGWEIDGKISYKLAKNLTYYIEAGYFKPGAFYEESGLVEDKKGVTQALHGLSLTF